MLLFIYTGHNISMENNNTNQVNKMTNLISIVSEILVLILGFIKSSVTYLGLGAFISIFGGLVNAGFIMFVCIILYFIFLSLLIALAWNQS